ELSAEAVVAAEKSAREVQEGHKRSSDRVLVVLEHQRTDAESLARVLGLSLFDAGQRAGRGGVELLRTRAGGGGGAGRVASRRRIRRVPRRRGGGASASDTGPRRWIRGRAAAIPHRLRGGVDRKRRPPARRPRSDRPRVPDAPGPYALSYRDASRRVPRPPPPPARGSPARARSRQLRVRLLVAAGLAPRARAVARLAGRADRRRVPEAHSRPRPHRGRADGGSGHRPRPRALRRGRARRPRQRGPVPPLLRLAGSRREAAGVRRGIALVVLLPALPLLRDR